MGGVWHPVYRRVYHPPPQPSWGSLPSSLPKCVTDFSAFSRHRRRKRRVRMDVAGPVPRRSRGGSSATTPPNFYRAVVAWYDVEPGVAVFLAGQFLISTSRIWFARMGVSVGLRSGLPTWPLSPTADGPAIVGGEVHHPVTLAESPTPEWLTRAARGRARPRSEGRFLSRHPPDATELGRADDYIDARRF